MQNLNKKFFFPNSDRKLNYIKILQNLRLLQMSKKNQIISYEKTMNSKFIFSENLFNFF